MSVVCWFGFFLDSCVQTAEDLKHQLKMWYFIQHAPLTTLLSPHGYFILLTSGDETCPRWALPGHEVEEALPAQLCGYSPVGSARPTRAFLSAEPHEAASFQPSGPTAADFPARCQLPQSSAGGEEVRPVLWSYRAVVLASAVNSQIGISTDFCRGKTRLSHPADKMFSFFKSQHQGTVPSVD